MTRTIRCLAGLAAGVVLLGWGCGGQTDGGSETSDPAGAGGAGSGSSSSGSGSGSGSSGTADASLVTDGEASDTGTKSDATSQTITDGALADGACALPANTCDDFSHIRLRKNLRTDGGCSWDEEVVDCHDLGAEICVEGSCTYVLR